MVPTGPVAFQFNFVFGQPFYLSMFLGVAAGTPMTCFVCNGGDTDALPGLGTGSATADLFNTMILSGLLPRDADGNPVLDAQFTSASNTRYSVEGVVSGARFIAATRNRFGAHDHATSTGLTGPRSFRLERSTWSRAGDLTEVARRPDACRVGRLLGTPPQNRPSQARPDRPMLLKGLERETGIEPATSSLGSSRSTAELLPLSRTA